MGPKNMVVGVSTGLAAMATGLNRASMGVVGEGKNYGCQL